MKKLMMAAAIVCAAVGAQAASVNWGGAVADPTVAPNPYPSGLPEGTQAALLWSATAFSGAATTLDSFEIGGLADNGGKIVHTYTLTDDDAQVNMNFNTVWDNTGKDVNGSYAILILNGDGSAASYMDMGSISGTKSTDPTQDRLYNDQWGDSDFANGLAKNGFSVQVGAVPEPTSGLLLLLGVAGLALRRRRM